jgi:hypothetical protein
VNLGRFGLIGGLRSTFRTVCKNFALRFWNENQEVMRDGAKTLFGVSSCVPSRLACSFGQLVY